MKNKSKKDKSKVKNQKKQPLLNYVLFSLFTFFLLPPANFSSAQRMAGGDGHSIALCSDGDVWTWGWNNFGQLGDNTTAQRNTPVQVLGGASGSPYLTNIIAVNTKWNYSVALKNDNTVWEWGQNSQGQLGDNTVTQKNTPVQVLGGASGSTYLTGITVIGAGGYHSLSLKNDGTVWAWGDNNDGQLGDNNAPTDKLTPIQVLGGASGSLYLTGITAVSGGGRHSLALKNDGTVWSWGQNWFGQIGDNTVFTARNTAVQVLGGASGSMYLTGITAIAGGDFYSLALKNDGTVWAWGSNGNGQLGDNTTTDRYTPVQALGGASGSAFLTGIIAIDAGGYHSLALKNDGTVWAWGSNSNGQLGDNTTTDRWTPVQVKDNPGTGTLTGITAIAAGGYHSLAINTNAGTMWSWGRNNSTGQLGDNTTTDRWTPVNPTGLCSMGPLPVELLSFSAICLGDKAEIKWSTASETNNDYFEIQRKDGMLEDWKVVGKVQGAGNSSTTKHYSFIDQPPITDYRLPFYYRLKQTDFNGQYEYFNPVSCSCKEGIEIISIYPNPSNGNFSYIVTSSMDAEASITVSDVIGKKVISQKLSINKGTSARTINASLLSSGMYYLQIKTSSGLYRAQKQLCIK